MGTDEGKPTDPQGDEPPSDDSLDEQEAESFPSSDPHSDWAGQVMSRQRERHRRGRPARTSGSLRSTDRGGSEPQASKEV